MYLSDYIFPELAQSEDEKIRKDLIDYLRANTGNNRTIVEAYVYKKWADWLEKQKPVVWSEEDEERFLNCIQRLGTGKPEQPETINSKWLKDLIYRIKPQRMATNEADKEIAEDHCKDDKQQTSITALVAEIETRRDIIRKGINSIPLTGRERADATLEYEILGKIRNLIGLFGAKEVDFIKDFYTYSEKHKLMDKKIDFYDIEKAASFFFQLGLKAQKGE